jgi:glycosyltransferase involved in cell wall biosynthesis
MTEGPLVSICIPTYNRAHMVGRTIESALNQTYRNVEVVIVDNASTDQTEAVVGTFTDPRIRFIKNERNLGIFGNYNRCIELAKGTYLHILHSDDSIEPTFTERCIRFLEAHPEVMMTFTSVRIHGGGATLDFSPYGADTILSPPDGFLEALSRRNLISSPTVTFRREIFRRLEPFSLEFPYSSDLYQWLRISREYPIAFVSGAMLHYQQGEHSETHRLLFESPLGYFDTLKIYARVIRDLGGDYPRFIPGLNASLRRFLRDCLFAGMTRSDAMEPYSGGIFPGLALTAWGMVRPVDTGGWIRKAWDLALIGLGGLILAVPGGRTFASWVLRSHSRFY